MTEEMLWHIWKYRLFSQDNLKTSGQEKIEILKTGLHNVNAGPDFFNARIKIGETVWAGNVEIHVKSSDWKKHNHHHDKAYSSVVLHVVYEHDSAESSEIPVLELKECIHKNFLENYERLIDAKNWIPCEKQLPDVKLITIQSWLHRMLVERLERKTQQLEERLVRNNFNWEETFYHQLSENFGFKVNSEAFEMLARSAPLLYLAKHKDNLLQVEAFFFGQAGLLEKKINDPYYRSLQAEYDLLKNKFRLEPMDAHLWKFLRLRPVNFPTVRIAQLASLIHHTGHLFSRVLEIKNYAELKKLFEINASDYWDTHFIFGKESSASKKMLGETSVENLIINTVVPVLFLYGSQKESEQVKSRALQFLEQVKSESNSIIRQWKKAGIASRTAADSQALIELKNSYCVHKKCLHCSIGISLLHKKDGTDH